MLKKMFLIIFSLSPFLSGVETAFIVNAETDGKEGLFL